MVRRGLIALCLIAGAAAFRRRRFQPSWSFRRSVDWVIARTPTRYGDALRTIRQCMDCDALEVSLQNHSISLINATLSPLGSGAEALRVELLEVAIESYSPLVVSASLGTVRVNVEANDLLMRDTNWHRLTELEQALDALSLSSSSSSSSSSSLSGVRRLDFSGVAVLQLTPSPLLGGADSRVSATLDWAHDLAPISEHIARQAETSGSVSLKDVFSIFKTNLVLGVAGLMLARVLDAQDSERTSKSAISVGGIEVDVMRPRASLMSLADRFAGFVETRVAETLGLDKAELAAAAALLRHRGDGVDGGDGDGDEPQGGSRSEL